MRLRFLTSIATARGYYHEGRVIEVARPTAEMQAWIDRGQVAIVRQAAPTETTTATPAPTETTTRRSRSRGPKTLAE